MFYNVLFNSLYIFYKISKYKNAISVKINSFTLYYHYQNISLLIYNSIALFIHKKRGCNRMRFYRILVAVPLKYKKDQEN